MTTVERLPDCNNPIIENFLSTAVPMIAEVVESDLAKKVTIPIVGGATFNALKDWKKAVDEIINFEELKNIALQLKCETRIIFVYPELENPTESSMQFNLVTYGEEEI